MTTKISPEETERRNGRRRESVSLPRPSLGWQDRAGCKGEDTEKFFPVGINEAEQVEAAKAVCRRCPVRGECLEYALTLPIKHGIFGGFTEEEREPLRRNMMRRTRRAAA